MAFIVIGGIVIFFVVVGAGVGVRYMYLSIVSNNTRDGYRVPRGNLVVPDAYASLSQQDDAYVGIASSSPDVGWGVGIKSSPRLARLTQLEQSLTPGNVIGKTPRGAHLKDQSYVPPLTI
jgi:hypothetical protein